MTYDVAIIGAGASGLFCSYLLKNKYPKLKILLIDKNKKIGQKLSISGGGKCNITNRYLNSDKYFGDKYFLSNLFKYFNNSSLIDFLKDFNIYPKLDERLVRGALFLNNSRDIINLYENITKNIDKILDCEVLDVEYNQIFIIKTNKKTFKSKKLIVASGGISYKSLGATEIGYKIAKKFNHTITKLSPALVGFTVQKKEFWFKNLSGITIDNIKIKNYYKSISGSFLFTHRGCSGPAILNSSLYWERGNLTIDFSNSKLPKRFLKEFLKYNSINQLKSYIFAPAGNFGYEKAEVTKGGVNINEIDIDSFESKKQKDLYFIGEVLDITGELGGYNIQFAKSCAYKLSLSFK